MDERDAKTSQAAKNLGFFGIFEMSAVWFGTHVGSGFATGNQTMTYFVNYGWTGIIFCLISIGIVALVFRASMLTALDNHTYEYRSWAKKMYHPSEKLMPVVFEVLYLILVVVGVSSSIAGGAELFTNYNIPYIVGVVIMLAVLVLLTIFGANLVKKASSVMTIIIAVCLLIVIIIALINHPVSFSEVVQTQEKAGGLGRAIIALLQYSGYQSLVLGTMVSICQKVKHRKDVGKTIALGYGMNGGMIFLSVLMLFLWSGVGTGQTLPTFTIIQTMGYQWMQWLYTIVLCLALISTGTGLTFGVVARFEGLLTGIKNVRARSAIVSIIVLVIGAFLSLTGLDNLVKYGYGYVGYASIPLGIVPVIVINIVRTRKIKNAAPEAAQE